LMQCIRFWQREECTQLDLKFIDEKQVATYDKPLFELSTVSTSS
jgi:hypothetical protein